MTHMYISSSINDSFVLIVLTLSLRFDTGSRKLGLTLCATHDLAQTSRLVLLTGSAAPSAKPVAFASRSPFLWANPYVTLCSRCLALSAETLLGFFLVNINTHKILSKP